MIIDKYNEEVEIFCHNIAWLRQTHGLSRTEIA